MNPTPMIDDISLSLLNLNKLKSNIFNDSIKNIILYYTLVILHFIFDLFF